MSKPFPAPPPRALVLAAVLPLLAACRCGAPPPAPPAPDGGAALDRWTAWAGLQQALRESPDHLPARAEALVAARDARGLFELVRDEVATYPPREDGFFGAVTVQRWGAAATLRGGAGTPREKAELLAALYRRAGFTAEVVSGPADPARLSGRAALLRAREAVFAPGFDGAAAEAYARGLGHAAPVPRTRADPDGAGARALAASLLPLLPEPAGVPFDFTLGDVPLVRVQVDGAWRYAQPLAPGAAFGEPLVLGEPSAAPPAEPPQQVTVRLQAARASAPHARFTVVERTFDAGDVAGRRIELGFPPPQPPLSAPTLRAGDVEAVVPVLRVAGPGLAPAERERLATVGPLLTLSGHVAELGPGGALSVDGVPLASPADPSAPGRVRALSLRVQPATFPRVRVVVEASDGDGRPVSGLPASALEVREEEAVRFTLARNEAPPPRVVLLYDTSTSLPADFLGSGAVAFGSALVEGLYAAHPDAQVRVASTWLGAHWLSPTWAGTSAEARAQVDALATAPGASDLWSALADAQEDVPTAVVLVTDGDATDAADGRALQRLAQGAPVVVVAAGATPGALSGTLATIAARSSGAVLQASGTPAQAAAEALGWVKADAARALLLDYTAPAAGPPLRTVRVTVNGVTGTAIYEVPAAPAVPDDLSGLYLTLAVGGREHTATLAGHALAPGTGFTAVSPTALQDVRAMLLGRITVSVEAAAPPPSLVLDEWISSRLALRPLVEALEKEPGGPGVAEALARGVDVPPPVLPLLQSRLPAAQGADALTFETGPRVAALVQKVHAGGPVTRTLHLFPLSEWRTAADDPAAAFRRTLEATASLAVLEAELLSGDSTREALAGKSLSALAPLELDTQPGLTEEEALAWSAAAAPFGADHRLLAPLRPGAFWAVHLPSGTLVGMNAQGLGFGSGDVCAGYELNNLLLQLAGLLGQLYGVEFGGWAALAAWENKYVTMATLVIGSGAPAGPLTSPALAMACGMLNDVVGGVLPGWGIYDAAAGTYEAVTPDAASVGMCSAWESRASGGYEPCP
ncbi:MAG: hypothetical protein RL653_336 [Pseudomonadota bacterium]